MANGYPKIFVVGCPRSGTTWVLDIFRRHPQAVTSAETALFDFLREPWWEIAGKALGTGVAAAPADRTKRGDRIALRIERRLASLWPRWYAEWRPALLGYFESPWALLLNQTRLFPLPTLRSRMRRRLVTYRRLYQLIAEEERRGAGRPHEDKVQGVATAIFDELFARRGGGAGHVLVEKTPSHLFHGPYLLGRFPEARLIEVVRDGRDVCVSMDAYAKWMPQDRKFQIWLWMTCIEEGFKLQRESAFAGRVLRVRYEDLHADPADGIHRLLSFAGLPASADDAGRIAAASHISRARRRGEGRHYRKGAVGDFKGRLSDADSDLFRRVAGPTLARLGYA